MQMRSKWAGAAVLGLMVGASPAFAQQPTIEELMRNTRNNPLEDLGMQLPMICDRYEIRDDVFPGAGEFRGPPRAV
jgi:N-methylhydantoinase B